MVKSKRLSAREALIEAAFEVLSRNPGASLSRIAGFAGVGRATLHRHFSSRQELLQKLTQQALQEMNEAAEQACVGVNSYSEALKKTLTAVIPLGDRYYFLTREPIEEDTELKKAIGQQTREMENLVNAAKDEGLFDSDISTDWIVQAFDHLIYAAWECMRNETATPAQASELAWRTLTLGTGKRA
ncbi:MAG: TetR family transcriptional regulator [Gammaproteobacteria bacterium]|nr:TetR family transcriptional regulator [Gammaproteobacteria bacterium]